MQETKLEEIIIGRIEPKIYAFTTDTIPKYLKVGDTYREVSVRLAEWERIFGKNNIVKEGEWSAVIDENLYFRDYSVHSYLINNGKSRLKETDFPNVPFSNEFFKDATPQDVDKAIENIRTNKINLYKFLDRNTKQIIIETYKRGDVWELREPLQTDAVAKFKKAIDNGHKDLLMYAVMRFGKSFTSLCCAKEMNAKKVLVVSGKADVKNEWKQNTEIPGQFQEYKFFDSKALKEQTIGEQKAIIFVTLQDLADINKPKFNELRNMKIDLMIIDETHFGARADHYGKVIKSAKYKEDTSLKKIEKDFKNENSSSSIEDKDANKIIDDCRLNVNIKLHLSGTPYKIIMNGEFKEDQIISFCQYTDILNEQKKWYDRYMKPLKNGEITKEEWENPYYGFPKMIRFAFNLNASAQEKLKKLEQEGYEYKLSALFEPKSIEKDDNNLYKTFVNEKEVLDFLKVIGGVEKDENILSFLDNERIKNGKLCRHIVMVLPYCASCDAMQNLIEKNISNLGKLKEYRILNISGLDNTYKKIEQVKTVITETENGKYLDGEITKTITLTVNKMLTGCTVPEWDTMIYLKDTSSPQEYDQAIFRLQSQYIETYQDKKTGKIIKKDLKPQTILIDFEPNRMFYLQEEKSKIYNINTEQRGSDKIEDRIEYELKDSPIITIDGHKLVKVEPNDIMKAVSDYSVNKSITDEANKLSVDASLFEDDKIRKIIDSKFEINSKKGINHEAYNGEGTDFNESDISTEKELEPTDNSNKNSGKNKESNNLSEIEVFVNKFKSYYRRILFFAFLSKGSEIRNLQTVIDNLNIGENERIAKNLGLNIDFLKYFKKVVDGYVLLDIDGKIYNLYRLSHDYAKNPDISIIQRARTAINNFGKLGESEVITPHNIAKQMVDLLPENTFIETFHDKNKKFLDIASKMGEFATAIVERAISLGIKEDEYKDSIYSISTSPIAYEFTRFIYEALGLNVNNISNEEFTSYTLLDIKNGNEIDYNKIVKMLTQNKKFSNIKKNDIPQGGDEKVKFSVVVGNPPYQSETKVNNETNGQNPRTNIFQHFQIQAEKIAESSTVLIFPATRWIHQSGKGLKDFGKQLINSTKLKKIILYPKSKEVFNSTDISDGVSIVVIDKQKKSSNFEYEYIYDKNKLSIIQYSPGEDLLLINPKDLNIANKIKKFVSLSNLKFLHESILPRSLFGIESDFIEKNFNLVKRYINDKQIDSNEIKILTNDKAGPAGRSCWFVIDRNLIQSNSKYIDEWQVVVSSAHPGGQEGRDNQISIIDNQSAFGRARLALKSFKTEDEAKNFFKYANSYLIKYAFLLSHESLSSLAKYVPDLIDYTTQNSIVDFSESALDLNRQLYNKCNLSEDEINFIENIIKRME